ncbi:MAG: two pore domain potassium channel family protein [Gammaproteobacteria bacterium]|nr:MAG: two pore domain potassium channel family protein [Gammaproteobacteria bacterium]
MLLAYLKKRLPSFEEWMVEYSLTDHEFCWTVQTGRLLVGPPTSVFIFDTADQGGPGLNEVIPYVDKKSFWTYSVRNLPTPKYRRIVPYFTWAKKTLGRKRFFRYNEANRQTTDTLTFNMWSGAGPSNRSYSRASLFTDFYVLKLGGLTISDYVEIGGRNLSFVDLDYLTIEGGMHGSRETDCYFSSCRGLRIESAELNFISFVQCPLEDLTIRSSSLQDIQVIRCVLSGHLRRFYVENSRLSKWIFDGTTVPLDLNHSDLIEPVIVPDKSATPPDLAAMYRSLRVASQANGRRDSASKYYYYERKCERRALFSPYLIFRNDFPPMGYAGRAEDLIQQWQSGIFDSRRALQLFRAIVWFHLRTWLVPKFALRALQFKLRWLFSLLEEIVWGYGERPSRIVLSGLFILSVYSGIYYRILNSAPHTDGRSLLDCAYFSVVTFTTLGYGDITPKSDLMKVLCGSEALIGAFMMGLVVAGFANRSRY